MNIVIFNTKSNSKEPLVPLEKGHVRLYVCGITAYDYCHIGHARSTLVFDMVYRYLVHKGYRVTYVRNFTDIDDKIIKRAQEQSTSCEALSERFITAFYEDMDHLGVARPTIEPRATAHIAEIIRMVQELVSKGLAYQSGNDVYFAVEKFANYGKLSGRSLEDMQAGARVEINENKRNPMDFVLWKGSKPGEPVWDSPWGPGRPGWHIECSAMSRKYLGDSFDMHGGGKDLVFPHHENELAQSEGNTGQPFVRIWVHHGFVNINDEKMSKSLGNFLTIREVLAQYHPEALRLFVFSTHYRNPLDYSDEAMAHAVAGLDRLYECAAQIDDLPLMPPAASIGPAVATAEEKKTIIALPELFAAAMDDDFNTARAIGCVFEVVKALNRIRQNLPPGPDQTDLELLRHGLTEVRRLLAIMGLLQENPKAYFGARKQKLLAELAVDPAEIEHLIAERQAARARKEWGRADAIRAELEAKNVELRDDPTGTTWRVKS